MPLLYHRGFLLPRMRSLGGLAPAANALLFALQHFWQPYNIVMMIHSSANTIGAILGLVGFLTS